MKRPTLIALVASMSNGCLSVPDGPSPECVVTSDCDSASGEVCEEGTCWGNPPDGMFGAVISPPSDRKDLVPKELPQVVISDAGWMNDLQLEVPVMFSGRIEAICTPPMQCDRSTLGATITVTRTSQFHGGPGFKAVVESEPGSSGSSFDIALPPTRANDAHYTVTILPDGRGPEPDPGGQTTPAQLVPPLHFDLAVGSTMDPKIITLGALDPSVVDGTLMSSVGAGLAQYRVVAFGHWELGAPMTEVSTVDYTDSDGKFHLVLSEGLVGPVELVAKPYGDAAPTLHLTNVSSAGSVARTLTQPSPQVVGSMVPLKVTVMGVVDGGGNVGPVRGARVRVSGVAPPVQLGGASATFAAEATTDDNGKANLDVLNGSIKGSYKVEIVPPASATVGVMFDHPLTSLEDTTLILTSRIPIRGHVLDIHGDPLEDVSVTARPSLRFIWSLDDVPQAFLSAIPAATTVTPSTGEFVLWVDPTVAGTWGHYDLVFEPSFKSRAPSWVESDIEIPRMLIDSLLLPELRLPDAAFVHGTVSDAYGSAVNSSEVKVFRLDTSLALCSEVTHAPASCPIPALLQGRGTSDDQGLVRLTLPR